MISIARTLTNFPGEAVAWTPGVRESTGERLLCHPSAPDAVAYRGPRSMPHPTRRALIRSRDDIKLMLLLFVHAAVGAVICRYGTDLQDEGLFHSWGARLLRGELPYTDFYLVQAPGSFYIEALLLKLFGVSWMAGRVFKQLEGLVVIVLSYLIVRRASGSSRAAVVSALAATLFSAALHFRLHWYATDAGICLLIAALLGVGWVYEAGWWRLVAAGAAIGCSILFKQNQGVFGGAALVGFLVWAEWRASDRPQIGQRARDALAAAMPIALGAACVVAPYLVYYTASGGSLRLLWLNSFVWASEAKGLHSIFAVALYPASIFSLIDKGTIYAAASLTLLAGLALALARRSPVWLRIIGFLIGAATAPLGPEVLVRVYVWSFGALLVFGIAGGALLEAAQAAPEGRRRAHACALVAVIAAANLYGGTIPGGGWGRLAETLTGTLLCFGIAAALLRGSDGAFSRLWYRLTWISPRAAGVALAASAVLVAAGLLVTNRAYRPSLDVGFAAMQGEAQEPGWRGIRGDRLYVAETDALIRALRGLPDRQRDSVFVFPLNSALYPLAGVRNPTSFDSLQKDLVAPSQFPRLLDQLRSSPPAAIVLQRAPNSAFGPVPPPSAPAWVDSRLNSAVREFVHTHYQLHTQWQYYELWEPSEPQER